MNSGVFEDYLKQMNRTMKRQGRHILLFIDNVPSHPHLEYSNIKLVFLPPNTTSLIQPMDQGIIQTFKLKYRKRQLQHVIAQAELYPSKSGTEVLKGITLFECIFWCKVAWEAIAPETIQKCFAKCGFGAQTTEPVSEPIEDRVPLQYVKLSEELFGCNFDDLVEIDKNFVTCETTERDWDNPHAILSELRNESLEVVDEVDELEDDEGLYAKEVVSLNKAHECVELLKEFAGHHDNVEMLNDVMALCDKMVEMRCTKMIQRDIRSYFVKS